MLSGNEGNMSCLSVMLVYCGQTVAWIKIKLGMDVGLDRPRPHCVRWRPSSPKRGIAPQFSAHVYCGQTAGCVRIPLGTEVGFGPGDIVLDGNSAPPESGTTPSFRLMFIVARRSPISPTASSCLNILSCNMLPFVNE